MKRTLCLLALTIGTFPAQAAVGDVINGAGKTVYHAEGLSLISYGTGYGQYCTVVQADSPRLYDSNKGGPWTSFYNDGKTPTDSLMCWTHVATNSIQYWQDVYGVFYRDSGNMEATASDTPRNLPNGYYDLEDEKYAQKLNIARQFYYNWPNSAGKFKNAVEWYFKWDSTTNPSGPGGYYSEYFGNGNSTVDSHVTILAESMEDLYAPDTSPGYTPLKDGDLNSLKEALLPGFGLTKQSNGTYIQTEEGLIPSLSIHELNKGTGHVLSCQGFTTDANGNLVSLLIADGDDGITRLQEVYVHAKDGYLKLYKDKAGTKAFYSGLDYYIYEVSYIKTPEVLKNMLSEYRSMEEAAVWNGGATEWRTQVDIVDSDIADASTGWDVLVNGSNIAEKHHGYYHGYAHEGRAVEFGDHAAADQRSVTIVGTVSAQDIEVTAAGYEFKAGEGANITTQQENATLNIRSGGTLTSEVALDSHAILLENDALLTLRSAAALQLSDITMHSGSELRANVAEEFGATIKINGHFTAGSPIMQPATLSMRSSIIPEANIFANLDLTAAESITIENQVNLNGYELKLSSATPITLNFTPGGTSIPFFTNIGQLYIDDIPIGVGSSLSGLLTITNMEAFSGYSLSFSNGALNLIVPEPATATLSLLALTALTLRRRRK